MSSTTKGKGRGKKNTPSKKGSPKTPAQGSKDGGVVQVSHDDDGISTIRLGLPSEGMITLTVERLDSLERAIQDLETRSKNAGALKGVLVTGPGPGMFAAGADIGMIQSITDPVEGAKGAERGRKIFTRLGALPVPVAAAIDGPCLGGALELALAVDYRIAAKGKQTSIGLPEVKLGIIPGFGGTQLLTRLVGLPKALDLILKGKMLRAEQALKAGVVDRIAPPEKLVATARDALLSFGGQKRRTPKRRLRGSAFWLSKMPPLRNMVQRKVHKTLSEGPARFYDAPKRALELCLDALRLPVDRGFESEARALGELIASPTAKGLVHLYFLTERAKRTGKKDGATDVQRTLILGGGVMGAGIAGLLAGKNVHTRLCDLVPANLLAAKTRLAKVLGKKVRRKRMKKHEATAVQDRLSVSSDWGMLGAVDMLLEAVPESMDLKRKIFAEAIDRGLRDDAIIATNTSSLSIDEMAASVPNPERVVGVHFFNPPEKMPLVEIIRGKQTSDAAVASACKLAVRLGKFPVVVRDGAGFLVNRCLAPYINEAARLMVEGNSPEFIDSVMLDFGLPMGPARLLDEVGFDVAAKVSEVLADAFSERMTPSPFFAGMVEAGHLGMKKSGGLYDKTGKQPGPGRSVLAALRTSRGGADRLATRTEVIHRLIYPMVAEAYRILDEGLVEDTMDLDLGLVFGMGFPPFTGGVTKFAEREGIGAIVDAMQELAEQHGSRFDPPKALVNKR